MICQGDDLTALALLLHSLPLHAAGEALVVATELASVPLSLVNQTVAVLATRVCQLLPHSPLEKSLKRMT